MRFVELIPEDDRSPISLHPRLTVLRGMADRDRAGLAGVLNAVAAGDRPAWDGTADVHGVLVDVASLGELVGPADGEPVISGIGDLMPPPAEAAIDSSRDRARRAHADAATARAAIEAAVRDHAAELEETTRAREEVAERVDESDLDIIWSAASALDRADAGLRRAAGRTGMEPFSTLADPAGRRQDLEESLEEYDAILGGLVSGDRSALAGALATLRARLTTGDVADPEAVVLAELWQSLHSRLDGLESRLEGSGGGVETVGERLEQARAAARVAEDATTPREISAEDEIGLERLHDELMDLEAKATRGVRRRAARRHLRQKNEELQVVLDRVGFPTWTAYRMGDGLATIDPDRYAELEAANDGLVRAELEWADLLERLENDRELNQVLEAIEQVHDRACELLGRDPALDDGDDAHSGRLADLLAERRVPAGSLAADLAEARGHLLDVLDECGATGHRELLTEAALVAFGESWLALMRAADDAAVRVLRDRERAEDELTILGLAEPRPSRDLLADERAEVHEAELAVAELRRRLVTRVDVRREMHTLVASELSQAEAHDAKLELLEAARTLEHEAASRLSTDAGRPSGIAALVPRGLGGAVPVMVEIDEADDGEGRLGPLLAAAADVQVIVACGDEADRPWLRSITAADGAVVDLARSR